MPVHAAQAQRPECRTMAKVGAAGLNVVLIMPAMPRGLVVVADGSGGGLYADGNAVVADTLVAAGFAVVDVRLLTRPEAAADEETSTLRFNTSLLADRYEEVIAWARSQPAARGLKVGLFATGTCAAAALRVAAREPDSIDAIVCRASRPELVTGILGRMCAETLLIIGERDVAHLEQHRSAQRLAPPGIIEVAVIANGRPLLDTPVERQLVADRALAWFATALHRDGTADAAEVAGSRSVRTIPR